MAEATLRGHVEIDGKSAQALAKAGWPVEVRYFIPKVGTKAAQLEPTVRPKRNCSPKARNNLIGPGTVPIETVSGDRARVARACAEAFSKVEQGMVRRSKLRAYVAGKLKLKPQQVSSQFSHLIRLGILTDHGQFPPEWEKGKRS